MSRTRCSKRAVVTSWFDDILQVIYKGRSKGIGCGRMVESEAMSAAVMYAVRAIITCR